MTSFARPRSRRHGFDAKRGVTLIELLVVIAVVGILAALLFGAVQYGRETARRAQCTSNLRQIGIAVQAYDASCRAFPPSSRMSFLVRLLPYVEQAPVYSHVDFRRSLLNPANAAVNNTPIPLYRCPSDFAVWFRARTNYFANYGTGVQTYGFDGVFRPLGGYYFLGEPKNVPYIVRSSDVLDGLSNTAAVSEALVGLRGVDNVRSVFCTPTPLPAKSQLQAFVAACESLPLTAPSVGARGHHWAKGGQVFSGYNHVLPPGSRNCNNGGLAELGTYNAASMHGSGANVLYADAHIEFTDYSIDPFVWRAIGSRNGGEAVESF